MCLRQSECLRDVQVVEDAGQDCGRMLRLLCQGAHFDGPRGALLQRYLRIIRIGWAWAERGWMILSRLE